MLLTTINRRMILYKEFTRGLSYVYIKKLLRVKIIFFLIRQRFGQPCAVEHVQHSQHKAFGAVQRL